MRVSSEKDTPAALEFVEAAKAAGSTQTRPIYDPVEQRFVESAIVERSEMRAGDSVLGPAVIVESQTTTVLGSHHQAVAQPDGTLLITRGAFSTRAVL